MEAASRSSLDRDLAATEGRGTYLGACELLYADTLRALSHKSIPRGAVWRVCHAYTIAVWFAKWVPSGRMKNAAPSLSAGVIFFQRTAATMD